MKEEKEKKQSIVIGMMANSARFPITEAGSVLGFINEDGVFFPNGEKKFSAEVLVLIAKKCDLVRITMESLSNPPAR